MSEAMDKLQALSKLLKRYRRRRVGTATLQTAWLLIIVHSFILTVLGWFSIHYPLSPNLLLALAWSYVIYLALPVAYLFQRSRPANKQDQVAQELDRANPFTPDPFRTSLSLGNHGKETIQQLDHLYASVLPTLSLPRPTLLPLRKLLPLAFALSSLVASAFLSHQPLEFMHRVSRPWSALQGLPILRFQWEEPRQILGKGDTAKVQGSVLHVLADQTIYAYVQSKGSETRYPLNLTNDGHFDFSFGPANDDFNLYFAGANGHSATIRFQVRPRPFLAHVQAILMPPGYTHLHVDTLPVGVTHFSVLPGTQVTWKLASERNLKSLTLRFQNRDTDSATRSTSEAENLGSGREFHFMKTIRKATEYSFGLADEVGVQSTPALPSRVDLIPDLAPEVVLVSPAEDTALDRDAMLPLIFRVKDDFGISALRLVYRVLADGKVRSGGGATSEGQRDCRDWLSLAHSGLVEATWDMTSLHLQADNEVEFHLVAVDNDTVNGPKSGKSSARILRMRTIQELVSATHKREQSAVASLKSALQREKQLERKLEREKQAPPEEGPPMLAEYEVNRIMVEDPHDHLRRMEMVLAMLQQMAEKSEKFAKPVGSEKNKAMGNERSEPRSKNLAEVKEASKELQTELKRNEPAMPKGNQGFLPIEDRRKNLDNLIKSQKDQAAKLAALKNKLDTTAKASGPLDLPKAQLDELAKELDRNIVNQTDLQKHLQEEFTQAKAKSDMMDQAIEEQMRMAQDMQSASQDIKKNMEQGAKNGMLSPELMQKMKKVDELLREVLPDSLRQMMERKLQGQEVNQEELRQKLKEMLEKQAELVENLNRALAMLEQLRDRKRMQELKQALEELKSREDRLSKDLQAGKGNKPEDTEQKSIQQGTQKALADFAAQASARKSLQDMNKRMSAIPVQKDMQAVREALAKSSKSDSPSSSAANSASAAQSAASASEKLGAMSQSLGDAMASMENSVDMGEVQELLQESLALSRMQILIRSGSAGRRSEGWEADEAGLYTTIAQTSEWLNGRVKQVAAKVPFIGSALMSASRNLTVSSRETARLYSSEKADQTLKYTQNLSRELLKLIKMAQSGSGQGSGSGSGSGSGASSSNPGGSGEGQSGGDLSSQLQGLSGKQMAINQATYQLLKSMLAGRQPGQGQAGAGESGESGREPGGQGSSTLPGIANRQGELGEGLESLAEALGEEGGAGQKLRGLADQARQLEEDLRQGRMTPEELRQQQERFQSRLLDASNAMQERGQSEMRQAETSHGPGGEISEATKSVSESRLLQILREAHKSSKGLSLSQAQRKYLEEYYESLLTR